MCAIRGVPPPDSTSLQVPTQLAGADSRVSVCPRPELTVPSVGARAEPDYPASSFLLVSFPVTHLTSTIWLGAGGCLGAVPCA